jgi:hypothetical protein
MRLSQFIIWGGKELTRLHGVTNYNWSLYSITSITQHVILACMTDKVTWVLVTVIEDQTPLVKEPVSGYDAESVLFTCDLRNHFSMDSFNIILLPRCYSQLTFSRRCAQNCWFSTCVPTPAYCSLYYFSVSPSDKTTLCKQLRSYTLYDILTYSRA